MLTTDVNSLKYAKNRMFFYLVGIAMLYTIVYFLLTAEPADHNCARHGEYGTCHVCYPGYSLISGSCIRKLNRAIISRVVIHVGRKFDYRSILRAALCYSPF